jgi:iron complex outermembrane receptor protein
MRPDSLSANASAQISRSAGEGWRPAVLLACGLLAALPASAADELTDLSLEQLMSVGVVGASKYEQKQSQVAAAVTVITRDEIKAFGWRTLDEALASLPGTHHTYDRQYSYFGVRGFALPGDYTTRVLITLNGNRLNEPIYDSAPTGRTLSIDMSLVERIEFIPGPGGAVYGQNAMLGVVNIVTRSGAAVDGGEVSASWQWPQATREARATWGKRLENDVDVLVSASVMRSRGEDLFFDFGETGIRGHARNMDGERDKEFYTRFGRGPWAFEFSHGDHHKDDPTAVYLSDPLVRGQFQQDRYTVAQLQYQDRLSDTLSFSARAFAGSYRYDSELVFAGDTYAFPTASEWQGAELQLVSTALDAHTLMVGVEYQRNARIDQRINYLPDRSYDIDIDRSGFRAGIYAQDEWRLSDTLTSTVGLRMDRNNTTGTKLSPRLGLIWQALPTTTLKALYGRAHRAPNAYEREYYDDEVQVANPSLAGEKIDTLELVADHQMSRELQLRASLYRWNLDNLIGLGTDPVSGLAQYQSFGKVTAKGLELSALRVWSQGARLRASLALQAAKDATGESIANAPHVLGKLNLSTPIPATQMRLGYELHYDGERRNNAGDTMASYWRSNLHLVAERWAKGLEVSFSVLNLFDRRYDHPSGAPRLNWQPTIEQDGRSVRLALDYRF